MKLLLYGVSGNTVSLEDRNKYLINQETAESQLLDLKHYEGVEGIVVLSNSHRTEYYLHVDESTFSHGDFLRYLSEYSGKTVGEVILDTYSKFNADAIRHLLYLVSGMNSAGHEEGDLLKNAEEALQKSQLCGNCAGMILDLLFEKALDFSSQMQSLPSMASLHSGQAGTVVRTFLNEWADLTQKRFLLAGKESDIVRTAKVLFRMGTRHITIANVEKVMSETLAAELEQWAKKVSPEKSKRVFFSVDADHFLYNLSASDGIVVSDPAFENVMSDTLKRDMHEIRPYKKKQMIIDLSDSVSTEWKEDETVQYYSSERLGTSSKFLQEEVENARKTFEETTELEAENIFSWYQSLVEDSLAMMDPALLVEKKRDKAVQ